MDEGANALENETLADNGNVLFAVGEAKPWISYVIWTSEPIRVKSFEVLDLGDFL